MMPRRYVPAAEIAAIIGLTEYVLDSRYRPEDWASPRDFIVSRTGSVSYALDRLPALADALQAHAGGLVDAALALRAWAAPKLAEEMARQETAAPVPAAAPVESWATKWERAHD